MHHVIIGAGPAGVTACETLRQLDSAAQITLIGDEPEPPYSRMALPYYLTDQIREQGTYLKASSNFYDQHVISVLQARVDRVDTGARRLHLVDGSTLNYDRLLIASGSSPKLPPVPGMELDEVIPCWTLANARRIHRRAGPGRKVVLLGAGFIGCILLESLAKLWVDLTVVEPMDRMVPRMMNPIAGGLLRRWCEQNGVKVLTGTKAVAVQPGKKSMDTGAMGPLTVELDNGRSLKADLIIRATGVTPNVGFLAGSGLEVDQGIVVDQFLATNVEGVFAAGDVCQGFDISSGQFQVQAIQPTAVEHGRIAAYNMTGDRRIPSLGNLNMNVLDTLGLISSSFGLWQGVDGGESVELLDADRFRYLNLQFQDDRLVGATSLGHTENVGVIRGLIESKTNLGVWKNRLLRDPTRVMEAYLGSVQGLG